MLKEKKLFYLYFFLAPLILNFAFQPFALFFLAFFAFIPLFYFIEQASYKKAFFYGLVFGLIFTIGHFWWLYFLVVPVAPATKILLYVGILILYLYIALYFGLFSLFVKYFGLYFAPFLLPIFEFLRTKGEIGFPWGLLGYTQTSFVPFIQIASVAGVYGLSAFVIFCNLIIYLIIKEKKKTRPVILLFIVILIPLIFYFFRVKEVSPWFRVALVQPNVGPLEKGDKESLTKLLEQLLKMTKKAAKSAPHLIIYPETASLIDITSENPYKKLFQDIADSANCFLLMGTPRYEYTPTFRYFNGCVLFEPKTGIKEEYRKIQLVPFSEKIPYSEKFKFLKKIETEDMGDYSRGEKYTVFKTDRCSLSVAICFESIFPDLVREFIIRGSRLLVNITNDGWFGKTPGPYQHCELAVLRSVELGIPLLRCANNGISLIADPYGRVQLKTKLFQEDLVIAEVSKPLKNTIYRKFGDWFIFFSLLMLLQNLLFKKFKKRSN